MSFELLPMEKIKGSSPCDFWKIKDVNKNVCAFKVHITSESFGQNIEYYNTPAYDDSESMFDCLQSLDYEIQVYKLIQDIVTYNICPHFISYIKDKVYTFDELTSLVQDKYKLRVARNIVYNILTFHNDYSDEYSRTNKEYILNKMSNDFIAPNKNEVIKIYNEIKKYKYHAVTTKFIHNNNSKIQNLFTYKIRQKNIINGTTINIIFQITYAMYCLEVAKISHNDVNDSNIILEKCKPYKATYIVNGKIYTTINKYKVHIYDYNRSYAKKLGINQELEGQYDEMYSQSNRLVPNRDTIAIIMLIVNLDDDHEKVKRVWLGGCLKDNDSINKKRWKKWLYLMDDGKPNWFLQDEDGDSIGDPWYEYLDSNEQILENICDSTRGSFVQRSSSINNDEHVYIISKDMYDKHGNINIKNVKKERLKYIKK
jgi:hypothetical protein